MQQRPLKVYYCNDCGTRMPLYYKKDQPVRDDTWHRCYKCKGTNIHYQVEVWDWNREQLAKEALNTDQLLQIRKSAVLWTDYQRQQAAEMTEQSQQQKNNWPY